MIAMYVLIGVLGAAIGSFLSVVAHRLPAGESVVKPRSRCPGCGEAVGPIDNIPVISWVLLRGRCRHCGKPISWRYPALELATAASFVAVAAVRGIEVELIAQLPLVAMLVAVGAIDIEHRLIPNKILLPGAAWALAAALAIDPGDLPELLASGAGAFAFLLIAALAYPGGMGMGDVKLAGVMGLYLGLSVIPALAFAFFTGSVVGIGMMVRDGVRARKHKVPFGPFLALGGLFGLLVGAAALDWYSSTFL